MPQAAELRCRRWFFDRPSSANAHCSCWHTHIAADPVDLTATECCRLSVKHDVLYVISAHISTQAQPPDADVLAQQLADSRAQVAALEADVQFLKPLVSKKKISINQSLRAAQLFMMLAQR